MSSPQRFVSLNVQTHTDHFAEAISQGLIAAAKSLPIKYLYDNSDPALFERMTQDRRCYLAHAEETLLIRFAPRIVQQLEDSTALVKLGSRNNQQTRHLIKALLDKQGTSLFAPIDISGDFLAKSIKHLNRDYPDLNLMGIIANYSVGLNILSQEIMQPRLLLWLGSDISHMEYAEAARLLREHLVAELKPGDKLLLGIDLKKPLEQLHAAYGCTDKDNAMRQVSLSFAHHALRRINRQMQGNFIPENFDYYCNYNAALGCVQIYLRSTCEQAVTIAHLGLQVRFAADEYIHIHNSYK
ncbi:L-histidine N(alpha)-methyltransferase [Thiothrix lacustris]|uniref:L-histidine N(alpha)-methyltransferase n=1 Tax=Thiothrix lacustris TaxID=525917 RepID=UPI0027E50EAF|nr:L-histidine N(alpha)-methyltransferase [Thiothrix lacustris]WMP19447.1 L-histidine N(alpha)-methyltransferase [Thiothrix lacustris]